MEMAAQEAPVVPVAAEEAPVVHVAPAPESPALALPPARPFRSVSLPDDLQFGAMEREGKSYVVRLLAPLVVLTPPVALNAPLTGPDDEPAPFSWVAPTGQFGEFLRGVEGAMLEACIANKGAWLRKVMDDDSLRASFKSMFSDNGFKVKLPADLAVFDSTGALMDPAEVQAGAVVKGILVLKQLVFGRTEFGAVWRMTQARVVPQPKCLIADEDTEPADPPEPEHDDPAGDSEVDEFM
jgi:hypothetical protein